MNTNEFYKLLNEYLDNTITSEDLTRLMQAVSTDSRYKACHHRKFFLIWVNFMVQCHPDVSIDGLIVHTIA